MYRGPRKRKARSASRRWSPDGNWLLFTRLMAAGGSDIWVIGADLTNLRNVTHSPASSEAKGVWSPDGSRILFESNRDGDFDLYVINVDGTGLDQVTDDPGRDGDAAWSP